MAVLQLFKFKFTAMASDNEVQIFARDGDEARPLALVAIDEVLRIERKYSRYRSNSVISQINAAAGKAQIKVDEETAALLDYAAACHAQSQGLFDITSGVLRQVWDFRVPRLPHEDEIAGLMPRIGWQRVEWTKPWLRLPHSGMELDFGGIGKEYAADRAAAVLGSSSVAHALVNLGGDVRVLGPQADGTPWRIGIRHPRRTDSVLATIALSEGALATSGDYARYFELDGQRYCHILDPRNGRPVNTFQSVSIVAPLCVVAGSCATMAMLEGEREDSNLARTGAPHLIVRRDGSVFGTLATASLDTAT